MSSTEARDTEPLMCSQCGLPLPETLPGTMTAWLFRAGCRCPSNIITPVASGAEPPEPSKDSRQSVEPETASSHRPASVIEELSADFEILELAGEGGMGSVYKVRRQSSHQVYALKILRPQLCLDAAARQRFEREMIAASTVNHPHIVSVYVQGSSRTGQPFCVMDWVDGSSLAREIATNGALEFPRALAIFLQIADALGHAHGRGVIHRDLKPSNIMLAHDLGGEYCKLVDFGIAKILNTDGMDMETLTGSGELLGSPMYMSPEQCTGGKLDARSDLYSFGCVMYECLTGRPPFAGQNPVHTILSHVNDAPPKLGKIPHIDQPDAMQKVVAKCLEKQPELRYQKAEEVLADLKKLHQGKHVSVQIRLSEKRRRLLTLSAVAALLVVAAWAAWNTYSSVNGEPPEIAGAKWRISNEKAQEELNQGNRREAEAHLNEALQLARRASAPEMVAQTLQDLADLKDMSGGDAASVNALNEEARQILHAQHSQTETAGNLAAAVDASVLDKLTESRVEELGEKASEALDTAVARGDWDDVKVLVNVVLPALSARTRDGTALLVVDSLGKARLAWQQGRLAECEKICRSALAELDTRRSDLVPMRNQLLLFLSHVLQVKGDYPESERLLRECVKISRALYGTSSRQFVQAKLALAECLMESGATADALKQVNECREVIESGAVGTPAQRADFHYLIGVLAKDVSELKRALKLLSDNPPRDNQLYARVLLALGDARGGEQSRPFYERSLALAKRLHPPDANLSVMLVSRMQK